MQIHTNIDETTWQQIFEGTRMWRTPRTQSNIARYALQELYMELLVDPTGKAVHEMAPAGSRHIQCRSVDMTQWISLSKKYGSGANALRVALAFLHSSFTCEEPDPWEGFHNLSETDLMKQSTDTLRNYASRGLNIHRASHITGGKLVLVQRILAVRSSA